MIRSNLKRPRISAVIFDLDGLLVDSEALWTEGRNMVLKPFGVAITRELKKKVLGRDYRDGIKYIIDRFKISLTIDEFAQQEKENMDEIYKNKLKFMPGAREIIREVSRSGLKRAVTTGSSRRRLNLVKMILELNDFDAEVCGDEVENGKPAPEMFLKAAEKLDVKPQSCVVVEDFKYGIKGAHAAGMKAVAVIDKRFSDESDFVGEYKPDLIVTSLKELSIDKLAELFK